jgi:hypothetical protein
VRRLSSPGGGNWHRSKGHCAEGTHGRCVLTVRSGTGREKLRHSCSPTRGQAPANHHGPSGCRAMLSAVVAPRLASMLARGPCLAFPSASCPPLRGGARRHPCRLRSCAPGWQLATGKAKQGLPGASIKSVAIQAIEKDFHKAMCACTIGHAPPHAPTQRIELAVRYCTVSGPCTHLVGFFTCPAQRAHQCSVRQGKAGPPLAALRRRELRLKKRPGSHQEG